MTSALRTTSAVALAAIALTAGPALSAQAASTPHWKTLVTVVGAKVQACKVPETSTGPWKIKLRVDATNASGRVSGAAYITKMGETTGAQWKSGWVAPGQISALGSVKLPAGEKYAMDAGLGTSGMGDGGTFTSSNLPHC